MMGQSHDRFAKNLKLAWKIKNNMVKLVFYFGTVASLICFNFLLVLRRNFGYF